MKDAIEALATDIFNQLRTEEDGTQYNHGNEGCTDATREIDQEEIIDKGQYSNIEEDTDFGLLVNSLFPNVGIVRVVAGRLHD